MSMEDLLKDLQGQKNMQEDPNNISLDKLFNESFMRKYSSSNSFAAFLEKGNFQATTQAEIKNLHEELLDRHVARETKFNSWKSMLDTANSEYNN
ncbi:hypothetical protein [Paenibacillus catalpae]|nr:hypothetical protein [Paenibacillus catalpae]